MVQSRNTIKDHEIKGHSMNGPVLKCPTLGWTYGTYTTAGEMCKCGVKLF